MTMPATLPDTIRAHVAPSAIDKVTRFFNATLSDTFTELLQNARRSKPTRIRVTAQPLQHGEIFVHLSDDGCGIPDPTVLLAFGRSGWDHATADSEDPAGIGIYALSRMGCSIASRPRATSTNIAQGWRAQVTPECFLGKTCAPVQPTDDAPFPHGTSVSFVTAEPVDTIRSALERAARRYPLPVEFNGDVLARKAFLDGAIHVERWNGLVFGVFPSCPTAFYNPDLNFHGLTVKAGFPTLDTIDHGTWSLRADIHSCPEIEFVLPARKELVQNAFVDEMRDAARLAMYRAIATSDDSPALSHDDYTRAQRAGIDVRIPPARLRPWRPGIADANNWPDRPKPQPVTPDTRVMVFDPDPHDAQALWRAAERAGIELQLLEADRRYAGYPWYDALARIVNAEFSVTQDGKTYTFEQLRAPDPDDPPPATEPGQPGSLARPDSITIALRIVRPDTASDSIVIPADVAFAAEDWCWLADGRPMVTRDSTLQPHELADLLYASFFSPSDDCEADSWETQRDRFHEDAMHIAVRLLASEEEARKRTIANAVSRDIFWVMPKDRDVHISIVNRNVTVEFGPKSATAEGGQA